MIRTDEIPQMNYQNTSVKPLIHRFNSQSNGSKKMLIVSISCVVLGVLSGFMLSKFVGYKRLGADVTDGRQGSAVEKMVVGSSDTKIFKDDAQGTLEAGGINGEGTHKLIRAGGESQTVYLTSSVLDLSQFEGKNVHVWGETFAAKKAGWLMDVGKVEVLN